MPAKSGKQYRFMQMVAHGGKKVKGLSPETAEEFARATPKKKHKKWARKAKGREHGSEIARRMLEDR